MAWAERAPGLRRTLTTLRGFDIVSTRAIVAMKSTTEYERREGQSVGANDKSSVAPSIAAEEAFAMAGRAETATMTKSSRSAWVIISKCSY